MKPIITDSLPRSQRGSLLIVAMLLSSIIAIALGTYINLSVNSLRMADRTFYSNAAMNLVEMGIEEAMWSYQDDLTTGTGWSAWNTTTGNTAKITLGSFGFSGNVRGATKVYVTDRTGLGSSPLIIAKSIITLPTGAPIEKWIEITLTKRSKFALGLVAKNSIQFSGSNASVDSWSSDPSGTGSPIVPYSSGVANDAGSIGSVNVSSTISVNNADIWGTAAVGGSSLAAIGVGPNGRVGPTGTPSGTLDPGSVSTDFTANLESVSAPATGSTISAINTTTTLGAGTWRIPSITLNGSKVLTLTGDVTIIITASAGSTGIAVTGNGGIEMASGATVKIYADSNISIAGNGLLNPNSQPSSFQLWGTCTSTVPQSVGIAGNGSLTGLCYAPNGNLTINGNGDVSGSFVANQIRVTGNADFHYDESLSSLDTGNPYGISRWRELTTAADRAAYSTLMSF